MGVIVGMIVGVGVGVGVGVTPGVGRAVGAALGLAVAEARGRVDRVAAADDGCAAVFGLAEASEVGLGLSDEPAATVGAYVDDEWDAAGAGM
jgi:hypothetical protein